MQKRAVRGRVMAAVATAACAATWTFVWNADAQLRESTLRATGRHVPTLYKACSLIVYKTNEVPGVLIHSLETCCPG